MRVLRVHASDADVDDAVPTFLFVQDGTPDAVISAMKKQPAIEPEAELAHKNRLSNVETMLIDGVAGAAAGAAIGTLAGPVGMATGAAMGAAVGAVLGHEAFAEHHEHVAHDDWMDDDAERIREEHDSMIPPAPSSPPAGEPEESDVNS